MPVKDFFYIFKFHKCFVKVNEMAAAELKNRKSAKAKLVTQAAENSDGDF